VYSIKSDFDYMYIRLSLCHVICYVIWISMCI